MNKALLVKTLGQTFVNLPEAQLQHMTHSLIAFLTDSLIQGERIEIRGFGSFERKTYPPRRSYIPKTGRFKMTAVRSKPTFRASTTLLAQLNAQEKLK